MGDSRVNAVKVGKDSRGVLEAKDSLASYGENKSGARHAVWLLALQTKTGAGKSAHVERPSYRASAAACWSVCVAPGVSTSCLTHLIRQQGQKRR
jgi:hypothetical protein